MTVIALQEISTNLNLTAEIILWVNLIYLISFVAFSIPFTKIISQYRIKKSTKISILALFMSILLSLFSTNSYMFLLSQMIHGFISASLAISIYVMIVEEFSDHELGSALGIVSSSGYHGVLIAPSFMGFIIMLANWQLAFLILVPILLILYFMLNRITQEWATEKKPIDNIGSLIYIILMASFTYGLTVIDEYGLIFILICAVLLQSL